MKFFKKFYYLSDIFILKLCPPSPFYKKLKNERRMKNVKNDELKHSLLILLISLKK